MQTESSQPLRYPFFLLTTKAYSYTSYPAHSVTHRKPEPLLSPSTTAFGPLHSALLRTLQTEYLNQCKSLPLYCFDILRSFQNLLQTFYVLLTVRPSTIFVNNQLDTHFFFMYVYFYSLHISGSHVPIIRRMNCINATSGTCHSAWTQVGMKLIPTCIPDGRPHTVDSRCEDNIKRCLNGAYGLDWYGLG